MDKRLALLLCLLPLCSACAGSISALPSLPVVAPAAIDGGTIHVIEQGWHVGVALRRADIPAGMIPEQADFPQARYLELGWGDAGFYQADDPGLGLLLSAALWPSASVLHVAGVEGRIGDHFNHSEIIRIDLTPTDFSLFAAFLDDSFARDGAASAQALRPGHVPGSFFYPARGRFHVFNNCNTWVAQALEAAGMPMGRPLPITAGQLMARVRRHAAAQGTPAAAAATP